MSNSTTDAGHLNQVDHWTACLRQHGYCIMPDVTVADRVTAFNHDLDRHFDQVPFCDGAFYGQRTKRFGGLLRRSAHADAFVRHPLILAIVNNILSPWCDRIQLNLTQGIEIHPGALAQLPHRDQDMWQGAKGEMDYLVNVMWPLNDFTQDNGATILWPESHHCQPETSLPDEAAIAAEMAPGSVLLFLGSTLHGGGSNRTSAPRRGLIVSYCLGWLKPFENQWLVYPPNIARQFDPELAALVGYAVHRPNLGNYEGQCPSVLLRGDRPEHLAATDALRADQAAALDGFVAAQRAADVFVDRAD